MMGVGVMFIAWPLTSWGRCTLGRYHSRNPFKFRCNYELTCLFCNLFPFSTQQFTGPAWLVGGNNQMIHRLYIWSYRHSPQGHARSNHQPCKHQIRHRSVRSEQNTQRVRNASDMDYGEDPYAVAVSTKDYCFIEREEWLEVVKGHSKTTMPSDYKAFCMR